MKIAFLLLFASALSVSGMAQLIGAKKIPLLVKHSFVKKYAHSRKVKWGMQHGTYQANWGGKSGEDTSVKFLPNGKFVEEVDAISVKQLPSPAVTYVNIHYKGRRIKEADKVINAYGRTTFEAEIKGKDLTFDELGNYVEKDL